MKKNQRLKVEIKLSGQEFLESIAWWDSEESQFWCDQYQLAEALELYYRRRLKLESNEKK